MGPFTAGGQSAHGRGSSYRHHDGHENEEHHNHDRPKYLAVHLSVKEVPKVLHLSSPISCQERPENAAQGIGNPEGRSQASPRRVPTIARQSPQSGNDRPHHRVPTEDADSPASS